MPKKIRKAKPPKWGVKLNKLNKSCYWTTLHIGVQRFQVTYADDPDDPEAAKAHCEFIQRMLLRAMLRLGLKPTRFVK
jgi:hypothetical protein